MNTSLIANNKSSWLRKPILDEFAIDINDVDDDVSTDVSFRWSHKYVIDCEECDVMTAVDFLLQTLVTICTFLLSTSKVIVACRTSPSACSIVTPIFPSRGSLWNEPQLLWNLGLPGIGLRSRFDTFCHHNSIYPFLGLNCMHSFSNVARHLCLLPIFLRSFPRGVRPWSSSIAI